ncbi:MAG: sigma-54-dependent transcriptional regulator [Candidatus Muiribacteriaceae bacterium]
MNERILILEDEEKVLFRLQKELSKDYEVETSLTISDFDNMLKRFDPEIVVMDIRLPDGSALDYIRDKKLNMREDLSIILISGYPEEEYLIEGIRLKVNDFIKKPFRPTELKYAIKKIIRDKNLISANQILSRKKENSLIYCSDNMKELVEKAVKFAKTGEPVLITGESGTGKQLIANLIHEQSERNKETFLDINCATISETLLESQLFGHKKGAFTDAREDFKGFFELTDQGSLFLDEISEMRPELQAKILKVVESGEFIPLGGNRTKKVNVRIITASNRDLEEHIRKGLFRQDLFYRLNVFRLNIPPLRDRKDDILLLTEFFIEQSAKSLNRNVSGVSDEVLKRYMEYSWPGNVRELKNVIHRAVLLTDGDVIVSDYLQGNDRNFGDVNDFRIPEEGIELEKKVEHVERGYISKALEMTGGSQSGAAKLLGISRDMLRYRIKNYNIQV